MPNLPRNDDCCGCSACANVCPADAIIMKPNFAGFLYPEVDKDLCIKCGKCEKVCPFLSQCLPRTMQNPEAFIVQHKDESIRNQSTSGGAFSVIAKAIIDRGGVVFGASFDEEWKVCHTFTSTTEGLESFRNSKYVQSDVGFAYREAKSFLQAGKWVCFSGTPCQIQGFINFLGEDYEKLITVDIVCLGVPSPGVFEKYLSLRKRRLQNISKIQFRNKDLGYSYPTMYLQGFRSNKPVYYRSGSESDEWLRLFLNGITIRSSCFRCNYQKAKRPSNFTLWDCNNTFQKNKSFDDNKGTSNVIFWDSHSKSLLRNFEKMTRSSPVDLNKSIAEISSHKLKTVKYLPDFYKDSEELSEVEFFQRYARKTVKVSILQTGRMMAYKLGVYNTLKKIMISARKCKVVEDNHEC